jgi:hypothetical protein
MAIHITDTIENLHLLATLVYSVAKKYRELTAPKSMVVTLDSNINH